MDGPFWRGVAIHARRDMRGGMGRLKLLVLGVATGVAALVLVLGLAQGLIDAQRGLARTIVGGDISLRLFHAGPTPDRLDYLDRAGTLDYVIEAKPRAVGPTGEGTLVEIKGVSDAYPLYGAVAIEPVQPLAATFAADDGVWGAAVDIGLLEALGIGLGETFQIGDAVFSVNGVILNEPDRTATALDLGPRVLTSRQAVEAAGLNRSDLPVYHYLRLKLDRPATSKAVIRDLERRFPDTPWRIVDAGDGVPALEREIHIARAIALVLAVGILLVAGAGIGRAVGGYIDAKRGVIAILRSLGASAFRVTAMYLSQIVAAASVGVAAGAVIGGAALTLALPKVAALLALGGGEGGFPWSAVPAAGVIGLLVAVLFAVPGLSRVAAIPANQLHRDLVQPAGTRRLMPVLVAMLLLAGLGASIGWAARTMVVAVAVLVIGAAVVVLFGGLGVGLRALSGRVSRAARRPVARLALTNLARPGAATVPLVLALGLTTTLVTTVLVLQAAAEAHLRDTLPGATSDAFVINVPSDAASRVIERLRGVDGVEAAVSAAFVHARLSRVNGQPVSDRNVPPRVKFVARGDRGLSWSTDPPSGETVSAGEWWPTDYAGPPLASVDERVADALGVGIGDTVTLALPDRTVTARIGNLRTVDWTRLGLSFPILLDQGTGRGIPHSVVVGLTLRGGVVPPEIDRVLAETAPLAGLIETAPILAFVEEVFGMASTGLRVLSGIAIVAGLAVLVGAVAGENRGRVREAAILKVLGATRATLWRVVGTEFLVLGVFAIGGATLLGLGLAGGIVAHLGLVGWEVPVKGLAVVLSAGMGAVLLLGVGLVARDHRVPIARVLRDLGR